MTAVAIDWAVLQSSAFCALVAVRAVSLRAVQPSRGQLPRPPRNSLRVDWARRASTRGEPIPDAHLSASAVPAERKTRDVFSPEYQMTGKPFERAPLFGAIRSDSCRMYRIVNSDELARCVALKDCSSGSKRKLPEELTSKRRGEGWLLRGARGHRPVHEHVQGMGLHVVARRADEEALSIALNVVRAQIR
jgi:hypothetical protein